MRISFYRSLGLRFINEEDFNREFALAKAFFEIYSGKTKIRRKPGGDIDWQKALLIKLALTQSQDENTDLQQKKPGVA